MPEVGQKVQIEDDGAFDGWRLARRYASYGSMFAVGTATDAQSFGVRWRDAFDYRLQLIAGSSHVVSALSMPNGAIQYFRPDGSAVLSTESSTYKFTNTGSGYDVVADGTFLRFDATGKLALVSTAAGRSYTLAYSDGTVAGASGQVAKDAGDVQTGAPVPAGQLIKVESDHGRVLRFERDAAGKISQMRIGASEPTRFFYSDNDLLIKVVYPGGQARVYHYNEPAYTSGANLRFALTGISIAEANGTAVRFATFAYQPSGQAIVTEHAGGLERHDLQYAANGLQTTVTDPLGTQKIMTLADVLGVRKVVAASQSPGAGSAAATRTISYDANGNEASSDDFNGNRTCKSYDSGRNLEAVRVEGLANTQACSGVVASGATLPAGGRKVSTLWHPTFPVPVRVAEPGKITTSVYHGQPDPLNGNAPASCAPPSATLPNGQSIMVLCRRVDQATTDADGSLGFGAAMRSGVASRENKWTYNARGQVLTHDGPRTDVSDITTYAYYADTTAEHTRGDLQSVSNAVGHVTQFTHYDSEGRLKRSVAPHGAVTETAYTPRGWISSTTVTAASAAPQTTTYTYELDSQPASVTLPDGTSLTYTYDAGRRLVGISDGAGNSVSYTLDAAGNRIGEKHTDSGGILARDIIRAYDALGRLMKVSGAAQ